MITAVYGRSARFLLALALLLPAPAACTMGDMFNGGCGSHGTEGLVVADLVGTWSGPDAGSITLAADGTFAADGLRQKDGNRSGRGTWTLNHTSSSDSHRRAHASDVELTFVRSDGRRTAWNRIDVDHDIRPVSQLEYLYSDPVNCDLRVLTRG